MKTPRFAYLAILPLLVSPAVAEPETTTAKTATKSVAASLRDYTDPDGAWSLRVPQSWKTERETLGDDVVFTQIFELVNDKAGAAIHVATMPLKKEINPEFASDVSTLLVGLGTQTIDDEGEIIAQKTGSALWNGRDVTESKVLFRRDDDKVLREGVMMAVLGKKSAFLVMASAPQKDTFGFEYTKQLLLTFAPESKTPGDASTQKTASLLNKNALRNLASVVKGNLKREAREKVLASGEPPLTYGSIAAYGNMLSVIYDVELTETEFDILRQTFIDVYKTSDAKGKADITGWEQIAPAILARIENGTAPKPLSQEAFKTTFSPKAASGNAWAKAILSAIEKRSNILAKTSNPAPKFAQLPEFDNSLSEADLEAALEMLAFMWGAAGREANSIDDKAIAHVRGEIVSGFASFPAQLQYILANAQPLYAGLRTQWQNADSATRLTLAQKFSRDLDALGLTVPSTRKGDAWSDWNGKTRGDFAWETVQGLAASSYKLAW